MSQHIWGELVIIALKAEDLKHQARGVQDPFCVFQIGDTAKQTQIDQGGGLNPIWDDQVNMTVSAGQHQLYIQIFNKDTNPANLMADGVVDLTKVFREKEHDGYFQLSSRGRPTPGKIYLELTFYPSENNVARQPIRYQQPVNYPPVNFRPPPNNQRPPPPPRMQQHQQGYPQAPSQQHFVPSMRSSSSMGTSRYPQMPVAYPVPPPHQQQPLLSAPYNPGQRPPPMHHQQRPPPPHQVQRPPPPTGHYQSNRPPPHRPVYQQPPTGYQQPVNYRPNNYHH